VFGNKTDKNNYLCFDRTLLHLNNKQRVQKLKKPPNLSQYVVSADQSIKTSHQTPFIARKTGSIQLPHLPIT
jgi:hypothetical protein